MVSNYLIFLFDNIIPLSRFYKLLHFPSAVIFPALCGQKKVSRHLIQSA